MSDTNQMGLQQRLLSEVSAAVAISDLNKAMVVANLAISNRMRHPTFHNARGLWLQHAMRYAEAYEEFRRALALSPGDPTILNAIGLCLMKAERYDESLAAYDAALARAPNVALTHYRKGLTLAMSGDHDTAEPCYLRAIELDPNLAEALGSLASIYARKAKAEEARALAARALALNPKEETTRVALAILEVGEKRYQEAEARLRELLADSTLGPQPRAAVLGLLGDALDGQKRYPEAFQAYVQENEELRAQNAQRFNRRAIDAAHHMIDYFEKTPAEIWRAPDDGGDNPGGPQEHVFLLGFMRSGTTLLEQVLASNPRIVALEEKALLNGLGERYLTSGPAIDALSRIRGTELEQCRRLYWDRIRKCGIDVNGKVFVDKQPLNSTKLPLIAKFFPKAKILFALRDPRDVVFSCYRRHFGVNVTMFEFLNLEDSARFYSAVMRLVELYLEKLPLNVFEHRYEAMVEDFEGRVRAVCDFIGVEWDDSMRAFNKYAPAVDLRSPSATQVRKPLYSEALAQWRCYADQLAPILPILRPWAEKFGYPPE